jgi:hypothetical protein
MLKQWAIFGQDAACATKEAHAEKFMDVVAMIDNGRLPTNDVLDSSAPFSW